MDHGVDLAGLKFIAPGFCPDLADVADWTMDRLRRLRDTSLGVIEIDDLDRVGEVGAGEVPYPFRAITYDSGSGSLSETPSQSLALDTQGEFRRSGVGIALCCAFNGSGIGHRSLVANGNTFLIG